VTRRRPSRAGLAAAGAAALLLAGASPAAAHGIGGRSDLPLPVWMFAYGAAGALVVSFAALSVFWPAPRLQEGMGGRVLVPADRAGVLDGLALVGRAVGVLLYAVVLGAALFGPGEAADNLAPAFVYITFWVGLTFLCAVVGDVWSVISPFPALAAAFGKLRRRPERAEPRQYVLGRWPAALALLGFVWLELAYPDRAEPRQLGVIVLLYTAVVLAGAMRWGLPFLGHGEGFAGFFGILSAAGVLHRDGRGQLRLRPPLVGLPGLRVLPGTVAVIVVALGSTSFDGLSRTRGWLDLVGNLGKWPLTAALTFGLLAMIALVGALYVGAMGVVAHWQHRPLEEMTGAFAHTLVPIVVAYAVAHYFSFFFFEGQSVVALASDPFGRGWDLFGTADRVIDYRAVSPRVVSWVQVLAIVAGHVAGVVLAHDRALGIFPDRREATRSQYPLLVTMVLFTVGGLTLLLST
jgi:hypothetical protein